MSPKRRLLPGPPDQPEEAVISDRLILTDEAGTVRGGYDAGESVLAHARGLEPMRTYELTVRDQKREAIVSARVLSDRIGNLPRTVFWPQIGWDEAHGALTPAEVEKKLAGSTYTVELSQGERMIARAELRMAARFERPLLYASDERGRVINGFELGKRDLHVSAWNLPTDVQLRVFVVRRQWDWHVGDPIEPVTIRGRPMIGVTRAGEHGALTLRLARAADLGPGAYQFIARVAERGVFDADEMRLHPTDLISARRLASLVVRRDFWAVKAVLRGCVMSFDMAGRPVVGRPYFQFSNTFQVGDDVWAAADPAGLAPTLIGKKVALYVIQHKTAAQWASDTSLQHLAVLGGNAAVQEFVTQPGCINFNEKLVWPNAGQPGPYDLVADFGNNPPTPATFARDDTFNPPLDMIDGYFVTGFTVVSDPTTTASVGFAGSFEYNEGMTTIAAPGEFPNPHDLEQKAVVYFPADAAGATNPSQLSTSAAQYPLVVVHGNSNAQTSYQGYNYLLDHLARNGMIAASIHIYPGARGESRARALFKHLELLKTKFPGKIDLAKIGVMGHSRGGEAVVIASKINIDEALGYNFRAIIALAPTDQYGPFSLTGAYHQPFFVIYGGLDGDLIDGPAFRLYDRAAALRAMLFVEYACHDRFNTEWNDNDFYFGAPYGLPAGDQAKVISLDAHQRVAKGYMNAFFLWQLFGRNELAAFFTGELTPSQVEQADGGTLKLHAQYEARAPMGATAAVIVDRFANGNWQANDLGAVVTHNGTLAANPGEAMLNVLDTYSPHDTAGAQIRWSATTGIYLTNVPAANQDVSGLEFLSFRAGQRYGSASNPANATQDLYIRLTDGGGNSRALLASKFATLSYPVVRGYTQLTKSALKTVRIPLSAYRIEVLGTQKVDLTNITSVTFEFSARATGELEIDDLEFGY